VLPVVGVVEPAKWSLRIVATAAEQQGILRHASRTSADLEQQEHMIAAMHLFSASWASL
jgi:hypothetical protein